MSHLNTAESSPSLLTTASTGFGTVAQALAALAEGHPVVVVDGQDSESTGDLIFAASVATPEVVGFCIRHTSGVLRTAMDSETSARLQLPLMAASDSETTGAFTVSVNAKAVVSAGISAADRTVTIRTLADPETEPLDLNRPGQIFPLRTREGGVLNHPGHPEAAVDLATMAGLPPVAALSEIVTDGGDLACGADLLQFATEHELVMISISDIVEFRRHHEPLVTHRGTARMPTAHGMFAAHAFTELFGDNEHFVMTMGDVSDGGPALAHIHVECLLGDTFGSALCECRTDLDMAVRNIADEGRGVLVYLRDAGSTDAGLFDDRNAGQVTAPHSHTAGICAQILRELGVHSLRLMTNSTVSHHDLQSYGIDIVERLPLPSGR